MAHIQLNISETLSSADRVDSIGSKEPVKKSLYEVISEEGLFKNGKHYSKGEKIELTDNAANNFLNNKEIKAS